MALQCYPKLKHNVQVFLSLQLPVVGFKISLDRAISKIGAVLQSVDISYEAPTCEMSAVNIPISWEKDTLALDRNLG